MIFLAMWIGLAVCLLAGIKLVDIGFSRSHWNRNGSRSTFLILLLVVGWACTITLALSIVVTGFEIVEKLRGLFIYGDLVDLMRSLLGY